MFIPASFLRAFTALAVAAVGAATYAECIPISSVPYLVSQSGFYCVTADLTIATNDGEAITVNASDVDIDFQGHLIINTITTSVNSAGVRLNADQAPLNNVAIRNGSLYRFGYGVADNGYITQATNLTVDHMTINFSNSVGIYLKGTNLRVTNNTIKWVSGKPHANGILLDDYRVPNMTAPNRAIVQGNTVSNVRAAAITTGGMPAVGIATGIFVTGFPDIVIRDNAVYGVLVPKAALEGAHATSIGVYQMFNSDRIGGLIIQDNIVQNNTAHINISKPGTSTGVWIIYPGDHAIITGSNISGMDTGINAVTKYPETPPVLLLNNLITGATTPIKGGITLP